MDEQMESTKAQILASHYKDTFDLTLKLWEERNRTFLILLGIVGIATLMIFKVNETEPYVFELIVNFLGIDDDIQKTQLRQSFPYGLIHSILLIVILYLMVQLYHRTTTIIRNYKYLGQLENSIRAVIGISDKDDKSFTREGQFYEDHRSFFTKTIGLAYKVMLGILLIAFLFMRIKLVGQAGNWVNIVGDVILAIIIISFFGAYAFSASPKKKEATDIQKYEVKEKEPSGGDLAQSDSSKGGSEPKD